MLTIGPMPTTHPWLSVSSSALEGSSSFDSAKTSESPICTEPSEICVMPWPEPPPWTVIWTSGLSSMNCSAAASTSGCRAVEPTAVTEPETLLAAESVEAASEPVLVLLVEEPQPARPRALTAATLPERPRNCLRVIPLMKVLSLRMVGRMPTFSPHARKRNRLEIARKENITVV